VSHRPLVFVSGLTIGDYLLWNWSLNGNHDVLALVSGLSLPPLAVACLWLLAMSIARLIARAASRPGVLLSRVRTGDNRGREPGSPGTVGGLEEAPTSAASAGPPSRKLAA